MESSVKGKGIVFTGSQKVKPRMAPEELRDAPTPQEEALSTKPSPYVTASVRTMFGRASEVAVPSAAAGAGTVVGPPPPRAVGPPPPRVGGPPPPKAQAQAKVPAPLSKTTLTPENTQRIFERLASKKPLLDEGDFQNFVGDNEEVAEQVPAPLPKKVEVEATVKAAVEGAAPQAPVVRADAIVPVEKMMRLDAIDDPELKILGEAYLKEEIDDPYTNPKTGESFFPANPYIPETRRGFSNFIKMSYTDFTLSEVGGDAPPMAPGDKYPYQKFVREYMRQASPYRGMLVYHGLGSGKTCTAIATSEALFSTANKKIIVMTPFSLRKNYLKEVSFCGFRHFHLKNHWVSLDKKNDIHRVFALEILGLSDSYIRTANHIWVPDFRGKPNYDGLSSDDQTEIRKQILAQLIWDAEKNPKGRIRFINYNGISAAKLKKIACENPTFFDNAVIIVDEIHNLIRLMHGNIDPYLTSVSGMKRRKIPQEKVDTEPWRPSLCGSIRTYKRGYLFYRLLVGARNSKMIGLSGTPLINFPEELGILANVLHGYIPMLRGTIAQTGDEVQGRIQELLMRNRYTDFVSVDKSKGATAGTEVAVSFLPEGIWKLPGMMKGVERMPLGESKTPSQIRDDIVRELDTAGFKFRGDVILEATPLLPPFAEPFRENFLTTSGIQLKNKVVLSKRLTGLISYYKGSRQDLMPAVKSDEVVRVPFSARAQQVYSSVREDEIRIELQKKDAGKGGLGNIWGEVYEISKMKQSSNYRMSSRQACNFTFPPTISRPRPRTAADLEIENVPDTELLETAPDLPVDAPEMGKDYDYPELDGAEYEDEASAAAVLAEDDAIDRAEEAEEAPVSSAAGAAVVAAGEEVLKGGAKGDREKKMAAFTELKGIFDSLTEMDVDINDIKGDMDGDRQTYDIDITLEPDVVDLVNNEFKTLRFSASGFSAVEGEDFDDDLTKLNEFMENPSSLPPEEEEPKKTKIRLVKKGEAAAATTTEAKPKKSITLKKKVAVPEPAALNLEDLFFNPGKAAEAATEAKPKKAVTLKKKAAPPAPVSMNDLEEFFLDPSAAAAKAAALGPVKKTLAQLKEEKKKRNAEEKASVAKVLENAKKEAALLKSVGAPAAGEAVAAPPSTYREAIERAKDALRRDGTSLLLSDEPGHLSTYSPKFAAILQRIMDAPGSSLLYSQFLDMEGIGIFRIAMDANGFAPIEIVSVAGGGVSFTPESEASLRKGPGGQMRYITFSGEEKEDIRRLALDMFNAKFDELPGNLKSVLIESGFVNNHHGEICRVFCITSAGAEGLSLKNVRAVHIMEPYWNDVRLRQVKGRAIRIGSHLELPEDQRNVSIYTYISVFGEEAQLAREGELKIDETIRNRDGLDLKEAIAAEVPIPARASRYIMTSDERLYVISERKKKVLNEMELMMKSVAVDCQLNQAENLDGTYQCLDLSKITGDFLYDPNLQMDIAKSESSLREQKRLIKTISYKGKEYLAAAVKDEDDKITGFELYDKGDKSLAFLKGRTGVKGENPAAPITLIA